MATVGLAGPHVVPIVFALAGDRVFTAVDEKPKRTRSLQRLSNIEQDSSVSLLADHYTEDWDRLWWVRADGRARVADGGPILEEAVARLAARYEQYRQQSPQGPAIVVEVTRWVGWSADPGHQPEASLPIT